MGGDTELQQLAKTNRNPVQETRYQQLLKEQGGSGTSGFGGQDMSALFKQQQDQENALIGNIRSKIAGQETLPAAYTRLSTEQGIPTLQGQLGTFGTQIENTKALLDKLEGNINERTSGTMTTEAQRERLLAAEQYPLATQLGRLGAGEAPIASELATAEGNVQTGLQTLQEQQQKELQPETLALSTFGDQAAREVTGYSQENQNKLNVYLTQLQNNQALTLQQQQEAANLAQMEKEYSLKAEQLKSLGKYGAVRYDPATGTYINVGGGAIGGGSATNPDQQVVSGGNIQSLWG